MGYRLYIGMMPKKEYNKIKSLTKNELYEFYRVRGEDGEKPYIGVYDFGTSLYRFGKYVEFDPPKKAMKSFFKKKELKEEYSDGDLYVVDSNFLKYIIEHFTSKIKNYYSEMLDPFFKEKEPSEFLNSLKTKYLSSDDVKYTFDFTKISDNEQTVLFKIIKHIRSFGREWGINTFMDTVPYDLERGNEVTTSWKFEYEVFELVRIYKTFDWKRNIMIYYGY
jgi:hypothetical protein